MTTSIDTNVIVSLWSRDPRLNQPANVALEAAAQNGGLVVCAPVFAELMAAPGITEDLPAEFCASMGIVVEWQIAEHVWREAGRAFQTYAQRRRRSRALHPRRILADFVIGAHAVTNDYALLTMDKSVYRAAFPALRLLTF